MQLLLKQTTSISALMQANHRIKFTGFVFRMLQVHASAIRLVAEDGWGGEGSSHISLTLL